VLLSNESLINSFAGIEPTPISKPAMLFHLGVDTLSQPASVRGLNVARHFVHGNCKTVSASNLPWLAVGRKMRPEGE
jgi:hypothetical protein